MKNCLPSSLKNLEPLISIGANALTALAKHSGNKANIFHVSMGILTVVEKTMHEAPGSNGDFSISPYQRETQSLLS
jgi:hypothetical protein